MSCIGCGGKKNKTKVGDNTYYPRKKKVQPVNVKQPPLEEKTSDELTEIVIHGGELSRAAYEKMKENFDREEFSKLYEAAAGKPLHHKTKDETIITTIENWLHDRGI